VQFSFGTFAALLAAAHHVAPVVFMVSSVLHLSVPASALGLLYQAMQPSVQFNELLEIKTSPKLAPASSGSALIAGMQKPPNHAKIIEQIGKLSPHWLGVFFQLEAHPTEPARLLPLMPGVMRLLIFNSTVA
jgi:hypothetical protein